jgi:Chaperone of endosialidase
MNDMKHIVVPDKSEPARAKKAYTPPTLSLFGRVAALTQGGSVVCSNDGTVCSGGIGNMSRTSDRRLKQDIVRVGEHPSGFGLYLFRYKPAYRDRCGHARPFGVMADEVERVMPEAVVMHPEGYGMVCYPMLGIDIKVQ